MKEPAFILILTYIFINKKKMFTQLILTALRWVASFALKKRAKALCTVDKKVTVTKEGRERKWGKKSRKFYLIYIAIV